MAGFKMLFDVKRRSEVEFSIEVSMQERPGFRASHDSLPSVRSSRASRLRARDKRDMTVPIGIFKTNPISL